MKFDERFFIDKLRDFVTEQWKHFSANSGMILQPKERVQDVAR